MIRHLITIAALGMLLSSGCVDELEILNVVPTIPQVGPVYLNADDSSLVEIHFTIRDYEADPVDVLIEYLDADERPHGITQAWGSHGMTGLTSSPDYAGREHRVLWDIRDETIAQPIRLRIVPTDINGDLGQEYFSAPFMISDGLPATQMYTPLPSEDAVP